MELSVLRTDFLIVRMKKQKCVQGVKENIPLQVSLHLQINVVRVSTKV
jgi:hypothetical protein